MDGLFGLVVDTTIDLEVSGTRGMVGIGGVIGGPERSETNFPAFTQNTCHFNRSGVCVRDLEQFPENNTKK